MKFEEVLDQHKHDVAHSLALFNEHKHIESVLKDIDRCSKEYRYFYTSGVEQGEVNKQKEIEVLEAKVRVLTKLVTKQQLQIVCEHFWQDSHLRNYKNVLNVICLNVRAERLQY